MNSSAKLLRERIVKYLDLPGKTTAMDGGRDCSRQSSAFPPSMEVRSVGAAGSGSSKNLEGLPNARSRTAGIETCV